MVLSAEVLLLVALISNIIQAEVIKQAESSYNFILDNTADFCSISRWLGEDETLLWNSSEPENSSPHRMSRLRVSDSGLYQEKCWSQGSVTLERNSSLLICGKPKKRYLTFYMEIGQTEELACGSVGPNQSVQWAYEYMNDKNVEFTFINAETSSVHKVQPVKNSTSLLVTAKRPFSFFPYFCLVMSHQRCDVVRQFYVDVRPDYIYQSVGDSLELKCSDFNRNQPHVWKMPTFLVDDGASYNSTLVFPSLTLNHTGSYTCDHKPMAQEVYFLYVCPKSDPPSVALFTVGEELALQCGDWKQAVGIDWLMKTKSDDGRVSRLNPNGQGKMFPSELSLLITNVSVEDSGEFWCVVRKDGRCVFASKTLVMLREPEIDHHPLRSVLLSVAIMMMLVVVVAVFSRARSREVLPVPVEEVEMTDLSPAPEGLPSETPV